LIILCHIPKVVPIRIAIFKYFARNVIVQKVRQQGEYHKAPSKALLQYCELDTLAMVMIYEYWSSTFKSET